MNRPSLPASRQGFAIGASGTAVTSAAQRHRNRWAIKVLATSPPSSTLRISPGQAKPPAAEATTSSRLSIPRPTEIQPPCSSSRSSTRARLHCRTRHRRRRHLRLDACAAAADKWAVYTRMHELFRTIDINVLVIKHESAPEDPGARRQRSCRAAARGGSPCADFGGVYELSWRALAGGGKSTAQLRRTGRHRADPDQDLHGGSYSISSGFYGGGSDKYKRFLPVLSKD